MSEGAAPDEWLGDLVHFDRGLHTGVHALLFERVLERERVDHGCQHAHMVGGNAVHFFRLLGNTAKEIPAANHDRNLDIERVDFRQLGGNFMDPGGLNAKALACSQRLAGQFEKDALKNSLRHEVDGESVLQVA